MTDILKPSRRDVLKYGVATAALAMPYVSRAWADTVEINMLAWYGHGEPDMVGEFSTLRIAHEITRSIESVSQSPSM